MKTSNPALRRAADARALTAALAIADKASWSLKHAGPALSASFAGYLYVDSAQLLLVPTSADLPFATRLVYAAVREARADALVVSTARAQVAFALALWSSAGTCWQVPVTAYLGENNTLWMVTSEPTPVEVAPAGTAFPLVRGRIVDRPAPWPTAQERLAGERRAANWLASVTS